jgi:hypothetical protein
LHSLRESALYSLNFGLLFSSTEEIGNRQQKTTNSEFIFGRSMRRFKDARRRDLDVVRDW